MDKFKNRYRIPSTRLQSWDYASSGIYFITICTENRNCFFGKIIDNEMILSDSGLIVHQLFLEITNQFPFATIDEFIVMPNHIHVIIIIDKPEMVEMRFIASNEIILETKGGITNQHNPMLHQSISTIIRWYKGRSTFEIRKIHSDFGWQPRFHDHIIRSFDNYHRISEYIKSNPMHWDEDKFYQ